MPCLKPFDEKQIIGFAEQGPFIQPIKHLNTDELLPHIPDMRLCHPITLGIFLNHGHQDTTKSNSFLLVIGALRLPFTQLYNLVCW